MRHDIFIYKGYDTRDNFKNFVDSKGNLPPRVFNWKKMPKRTYILYITAEEKELPGHNPMKDRLSLLFCAKASEDLKIKPLLVYHANTIQK
jgi:hypothetical protein